MESSRIWEEASLSVRGKSKGQGKGELVAYNGHVDRGRELPTVQVVNARMTTLNHLSKFSDHAVHQLQPPKAARIPLYFLEVRNIFFQLSS